MKPSLNFKASPADSRDFIVKPRTSPNQPKVLDLSEKCTSVKDQRQIGSCTAFACVGMIEHFLKSNGVMIPDDLLSELFLYYNTRVLIEDSDPSDDSGAYLRSVLKAMQRYGVCLEKSWPYRDTLSALSTRPNQTCYQEGQNYQVVKYASVPTTGKATLRNSLTDMKALLASGKSFVGGVILYSNYSRNVKGVIPLPRGSLVGGHAVLFVGYDDTKQLLKFKNSWGLAWGDRGYGYLPYNYVLSGNVCDVWTIYGQEYANKEVGSVGAVIPPSIRQSVLDRHLNTIMTALAQYDDDSGKPAVMVERLVMKLKTLIQSDANNSMILSTDLRDLIAMIDGMVSVAKNVKSKMKI